MTQSSSSNEEDARPLSQLMHSVKDAPLPLLSPKLFIASACSTSLGETLKAPDRYKREVISRIQEYLKKSKQRKRLHNILQLTIFIGAALVPVTLAIPDIPKLVPALLGGIITIATAMVNYYKFGEHSRDYFLVAEELGLEHNRFDTMRGIYKNLSLDEAFPLFMDRVELIISDDTKRCFALETSAAKGAPNLWDVDKNTTK
jgi:multidrug transporter EmrE-like cation transporter